MLSSAIAPSFTSITIQVIHDKAEIILEQSAFSYNRAFDSVTFRTLIPDGATIVQFSGFVGPKLLESVVRQIGLKKRRREKRKEARKPWPGKGKVPQNSHRPDFMLELGSVPAETTLGCKLAYVFSLLQKPMVDTDAAGLSSSVIMTAFAAGRLGLSECQGNIEIKGYIFSHGQISRMECASSFLRFVLSDTRALRGTPDDESEDESLALRPNCMITMPQITNFPSDGIEFNIFTPAASVSEPFAWLETHQTRPTRAIMVHLPGHIHSPPTDSFRDREFLFVADRSWSMEGILMETLRSSLEYFLGSLPSDCSFNIWSFGRTCSSLWPQGRPFNDETLTAARAHIRDRQFDAFLGGTDLLRVLQTIANSGYTKPSTDIIVLTDGDVMDHLETVGFIKGAHQGSWGRLRYSALGIGTEVSHSLVEGVATAGGGYGEIVLNAEAGGWEERVVSVLDAAKTSHAGIPSIGLEVDGLGTLTNPKEFKILGEVRHSPADLGTLSPIDSTQVYILLNIGGSEIHDILAVLLLARRSPDDVEVITRVPVKRIMHKGTLIHHVATQSVLSDLEKFAEDATESVSRHIEKEGSAFACEWGLESRWTKLEVDERRRSVLEERSARNDAPEQGKVGEQANLQLKLQTPPRTSRSRSQDPFLDKPRSHHNRKSTSVSPHSTIKRKTARQPLSSLPIRRPESSAVALVTTKDTVEAGTMVQGPSAPSLSIHVPPLLILPTTAEQPVAPSQPVSAARVTTGSSAFSVKPPIEIRKALSSSIKISQNDVSQELREKSLPERTLLLAILPFQTASGSFSDSILKSDSTGKRYLSDVLGQSFEILVQDLMILGERMGLQYQLASLRGVIVTIVILRLLQEVFSAYKGSWREIHHKGRDFLMASTGAIEMLARGEDAKMVDSVLLFPPRLRGLEYLVIERARAALLENTSTDSPPRILIPEVPGESVLFPNGVPVQLLASVE